MKGMIFMSRDMLSQEEIDALLQAGSSDDDDDLDNEDALAGGDLDASSSLEVDEDIQSMLTEMERDTIGEIGNISFGSAATALSTLLGNKVDITTPTVSVMSVEEISKEFPKPHVAVSVGYTSGFEGDNMLVIKNEDARIIADLMMGGDGAPDQDQEITDLHTSAVAEAMNQMMGSAATAMSTIFNDFVNITPPETSVLDFDDSDTISMLPDEKYLVKIAFRLIVGDLIDSYLMQLVPVQFAKDMVKRVTGGMEETAYEEPIAAATPPPAAAAPPQQPAQQVAAPEQPAAMQPPPMQQQPMDPAQAQQAGYPPYGYPPPGYGYPPPPQGYYPPPQPNYYGGVGASADVNVQNAEFSNFDSRPAVSGEGNLNLLLDVPLQITVELGRTKKQIKDILELGQGAIIELERLAGEPVDILVNNKLIAKGEVVVIDENFGVRVTDIISQIERVQKLQ